MRKATTWLVALVGLSTLTLVSGQSSGEGDRSGRDGSWAVGADLGLQNTTGDDDLDTEPLLGGFVEYFPGRHLSWRGMLQFVELDDFAPQPAPGAGDAEILIIGGNALYNWPGSQVSPFVTGGVALYDYDTESGVGDDTEPGLNMGGGFNFHVAPSIGLKLEALYHVTAQEEGPDSFVVGTGGVRFGW